MTVKVDIGCGKAKADGFIGMDTLPFEGVDVVCNAGKDRWPWNDGEVDEIRCSHMLEHLEPEERVHFANEAYRVLKKGGTCQIITPHWCSPRAYGDLTHKWPPVSEWWFAYLNAEWRKVNAPHNQDYLCDFDGGQPGYMLHPAIQARNPEYQQHALSFFKDAAQDMICTLTKNR